MVLYQIWVLVAPALYKHERGAITGFMFSTVFLFLAGIAFGYFITLPYVLHFLVNPGPLFMIQGDVKPIVTPTPDATTMLIFMAPMIGLYFLGIAVSAVVVRRKQRRLAAPAEAR